MIEANGENPPVSNCDAPSRLSAEREQRLLLRMRAEQNSGSPAIPVARPIPQIQDHELLRPIGGGAYGEVWLAKNVVGTFRAVKIVYRNSFNDSRPYEREFRGIQNFEPVSRSNDNLVDILQIGRDDPQGYFYYIMELADDVGSDGPNWQNYIPKTLRSEVQRRGRLPFDECLQLALSLTLALGQLHRQGLIHRDIKPSNIIFIGGVPKLADIGLVTDMEEARSFVGTEGFIPPEGPNSRQADIYSLGKVLYEISMGKDRLDFPEPFTALGQGAQWKDLEELNAVILKACASVPHERYQTAQEMHVDLALLQSGKSVKGKRLLEKHLARARKAAVLVGVIAALATAAYLFQRHQNRKLDELAERGRMQNAEAAFERGDSAFALATLADVLRRNPNNRVAAERILASLTQRNFPRLMTKPLAHEERVILAHFAPDGKKIASVSGDSGDYMLHLWDVERGNEIIPPIRHVEPVNSLEFSPDGLKIITASGHAAWIWDAQTGNLALPAFNHPDRVDVARFTPDGARIVTVAADGNVRVLEVEARPTYAALLHQPLAGEPGDPTGSVDFSPDRQLLATGSFDGGVRLFALESAELKHCFNEDGMVSLVRFSPDGKWLAATIQSNAPSGGWFVPVWDIKSRKVVARLAHENHLYSIAFSPDSQRLVSGTANNAARVWDLTSGRLLFELPHKANVYSASFSPDGRTILTSSVDDTARLWDAATGKSISEPMVHYQRVIHAEFSPSGEQLLTASWDGSVRIWTVPRNAGPVQVLRHQSWVRSAEFDSSGSNILIATTGIVETAKKMNSHNPGEQQSIAIWNAADGTCAASIAIPKAAESLTAQFTDAGPLALVAAPSVRGRSSRASIWDLGKGTRLDSEIIHDDDLLCARFSSDGEKVAAGSKDGKARVWDTLEGKPLTAPLAHAGRVNSVRFSPDNRLLVSSSDDHTALLWNAISGERAARPLRHEGPVWFAQFNRHGDRVITSSLDHTARVWSVTGALICELKHTTAIVEYAEFSPDDRCVITACGDARARLWNADTGEQIYELQHGQSVVSARFSPDGIRIVTASFDGSAQLWDTATGLKLSDPFLHSDWVLSAAFSLEGGYVVTGSTDNSARLWRVPRVTAGISRFLPDLAEAVAGQRLNANHVMEKVSWEEYSRIKRMKP